MNRQNFLLLLSLNQANVRVGQAVVARIKATIDANAGALWIDAKGIGVFISTAKSATEIWRCAIPDTLSSQERSTLKDMLILHLASDHVGFPEAKAMAWLNSHKTQPTPP